MKMKIHPKLREETCKIVLAVVLEYFNNPNMIDKSRKWENVKCRQIAHSILKNNTDIPYEDIGFRIGRKNHSTVIHSCRVVTNYYETEAMYCFDYDEVQKYCITAIKNIAANNILEADAPIILKINEVRQAIFDLRAMNGNIGVNQNLDIIENFFNIKYKQNYGNRN